MDLTRANLADADFSGADLTGADLTGVNLKGGLMVLADLTGAKLNEATLEGAELTQANLTEVDLDRANLTNANLIRANLSKATLNLTQLDSTSLRKTTLIEATLSRARLIRADLTDADVTRAVFGWTLFVDVDLSTVKCLAEAVHRGPSSLDSHCLARSQGRIPGEFLEGCGFAEWEILSSRAYDQSMTPRSFNDLQYKIYEARIKPQVRRLVFISYSRENQDFVDHLRARFVADGVRSWVDAHDLKAGGIERQIAAVLAREPPEEDPPVLLLVLSKSSVASDWVQHEVRLARELEKRLGGKADVLCPVSLEDNWREVQLWPERIVEQVMEKFVVPFEGWRDPGVWEVQYRKLLDGLRLFFQPPE